jgi:hypothetical protein
MRASGGLADVGHAGGDVVAHDNAQLTTDRDGDLRLEVRPEPAQSRYTDMSSVYLVTFILAPSAFQSRGASNDLGRFTASPETTSAPVGARPM